LLLPLAKIASWVLGRFWRKFASCPKVSAWTLVKAVEVAEAKRERRRIRVVGV
jgi:hypothetical protein